MPIARQLSTAFARCRSRHWKSANGSSSCASWKMEFQFRLAKLRTIPLESIPRKICAGSKLFSGSAVRSEHTPRFVDKPLIEINSLWFLRYLVLFVNAVQSQFFCFVHLVLLELSEQPCVRQIERVRVLPVVVSNLRETVNDIIVSHFDGQLSAGIEAARREIDRSDDCSCVIGQEHLGVKFEMFQFVNLDSNIFHGAHPTHRFHKLFLLELMRRTGHYVDLHSSAGSPDQSLNDDRVLVAFILK